MRIHTHLIRSNRGSALLLGVMVMLMVAMFGLAYVALTTTNLTRAGRDERRATAFYLAEAGLEWMIEQIVQEATANGGHIIAKTNYDSTSLVSGLVAGSTGVIDVAPSGVDTYATITSSATYQGITETVRVYAKIRAVGIWDNAIFAGVGQSGRGINGNVDIRGSVHILGDGEPFSDLNGNGHWDTAEVYTDSNGNGAYDSGEPFVDADGNGIWSDAEPYRDVNVNGAYDDPIAATELAGDLSGGAKIGNNYVGMPVELAAKIPALTPEPVHGEMVTTLNAELRCKHGKVNLSGTAKVGEVNVWGNLVKETVDGTYVTDGFGGTSGVANVYSDNGATQRYDLGDKISFPSLLDPYTDPATGITYDQYRYYLESRCLDVADITTLDSTVASFTRTDGTNSISWDQATRQLTISGIVRFTNAMGLDLGAKNETVSYAGKGTLYTLGDVRVHCDVMPVGTFPTADALGVISSRDINFATGPGEAQLKAAGAWYAQRIIRSAKQNQFAGTYVSNFFDMGTNVPNIYQVPALSRNLPPGMPGGDLRIVVCQVLSWRHM